MSLVATQVPMSSSTVRPIYVLRQLETIYAMAWTEPWDATEYGPVGTMNQLLGTELPIIHLNRIWVPKPFRGRKYGHTLLQHICHDANHAAVVLTLQIEPDDPADFRWIKQMYAHAGFQKMGEEYGPQSMVRWPKI